MANSQHQKTGAVSRRAVTAGMAWSVPAIAFASAAPAAAVSPLITVSTGNVCKYPGGSVPGVKQAYMFPLTVTNIANERVCVTISGGRVVFDGGESVGTPEWWTVPPHRDGATEAPNQICLDVAQSVTYYYVVDETGNSSNRSGTVTGRFRATGQSTGRQHDIDVSVRFASTPPDCKTGMPAVEEPQSVTPSTQEAAPATREAAPSTEASQPTVPAPTDTASPAAAETAPAVPESANSTAPEPTVATPTQQP